MKKKLLNLALLPLSTLSVVVCASCGNTNDKKDPKPIDKDKVQPKPEPENPVNPVEPGKKEDETKPTPTDPVVDKSFENGGTQNGLTINKYLGLINLFQLSSNKIASVQLDKIKNIKADKYDITNVEILSYSDEHGTLSFKVNGLYDGKTKIENQIVTLSGFVTHVYGQSINAKFDSKKLALDNQNNLENILNLKNQELLSYFTALSISGDGTESIDVLEELKKGENDSRVILKSMSLKKKNHETYELKLVLDFKLYSYENGHKTDKTVNWYNRSVDYQLGFFQWSLSEYVNYIGNHELVKNEETINKEETFNRYASFYLGKLLNGIDLAHQFYTINSKYDHFNNEPLTVKAKSMFANDLTGTLYINYVVVYENSSLGESIESAGILKEVSGFKKVITEEFLKKAFDIQFNISQQKQFEESPKKGKAIYKEFKEHEKDTTPYVITDENRIKWAFGTNNIVYLQNTLDANSKYKPNIYLNAYYNNQKIQEPVDHENNHFIKTSATDPNGIVISGLEFSIESLSDFKETENQGTKFFEFNINGTISISVLDSNASQSETKTFKFQVKPIKVRLNVVK
ncbi:hypothetical protein [Mycoplasmopsis adleri]|uniref:hypothetical protein n=1 Tax=Mycoplasmopsis adleri TaxID=51362 RepID=UPI003872FA5B